VAVGLALVLVAALMPGALADPAGSEGSFFGLGGEAADMPTEAEEFQAEPAELQTEPPDDVALDTDINGEGSGDRDATAQAPTQLAQANLQMPVDALPRSGNAHEQVVELRDPLDQSELKGSGDDPVVCAPACSKEPATDSVALGASGDGGVQRRPEEAGPEHLGDGSAGLLDDQIVAELPPGRPAERVESDPVESDPVQERERTGDPAAREAKIRRFQDFLRNVDGVTVGPEQAAAALDAQKTTAEPFRYLHREAKDSLDRATSMVQKERGPVGHEYALWAADRGKDGLESLWTFSDDLSAAVALDFESHQARGPALEAAKLAKDATKALAQSVLHATVDEMDAARKLSLEASRQYSRAAQLVIQAGKETLSPDLDIREIRQRLERPGGPIVQHAFDQSMNAALALIRAAETAAEAYPTFWSSFRTPKDVAEAKTAAEQAYTAYKAYSEMMDRPPFADARRAYARRAYAR
jgi:hypothetical protein